jgi:hypothetical protein
MSFHLSANSKLGRTIRVTQAYWDYIVSVKHSEVVGLEAEVLQALSSPSEVRRSKKDPFVYLYYRPIGNKFICVVTKHLNGEGFIVTVYLTRRVGSTASERVWAH